MPVSQDTLTITESTSRFSVGRRNGEERSSLVLPPDTVSRLSELCSHAHSRVLSTPTGTGSDAVKALVAELLPILSRFYELAENDSLVVLPSETIDQAIAEIERVRRELGKL